MKSIYTFFLGFLFISTCQKSYTPRNLQSIRVQEFKMDSTSIRAITVIDANKVYYAGSLGDFGWTKDGGITWTKKSITYQDSIKPHFRSLASSGKNFFALSIGNPALLYKITDEEINLVYTENHEKVFYDSLHFFEDGVHGIAVGDPTEKCASIIMTKNAGDTWEKIPCEKLPDFEDGEAFFAASNTNIKTLGNKVWVASGGKKSRILFSDNFGDTWQIFDTPIIQGNGPQGMYSIDFTDDKNGIAIGGDYSKPLENKANKAITKDGGKTWTLVADGKNPNYKSSVQYVPNTKGKEVFAVGKTGISFSNDGGITWKDISTDDYYTIQFVDKNTAWLAGHQKMGKLVLPTE